MRETSHRSAICPIGFSAGCRRVAVSHRIRTLRTKARRLLPTNDMTVDATMSPTPRTRIPDTSVAAAAQVLWEGRRDDDVLAALATMKAARVRRLPVCDAQRAVVGMLSVSDIIRVAGPGRPLASDEVIDALRAICLRGQASPGQPSTERP